MPRLADLGAVVLKVYYRDHDPPHFHAFHTGGSVKIAIDTGAVLRVRGEPPAPAVLRKVNRWLRAHRPETLAAFRSAQAGRPPVEVT